MNDIRWEGYSHEEIYAAVHQGPGRSVSTGAEIAWAETEALILRIEERLAAAMAQSAGGWEGSAGEATRTAMTPLGNWALDAASDAKITAQAVASQGEQARELRNAMPEPNTAQLAAEFDGASNDPTYIFHGLDDLQAAEEERANRAARAVDLMNGYTNNSYENRRNMDYWVVPPQVVVETTVPAPGPGGGAGGTAFEGIGDGSAPGAGIGAAGTSSAPGGGTAGGPAPGGLPPGAGAGVGVGGSGVGGSSAGVSSGAGSSGVGSAAGGSGVGNGPGGGVVPVVGGPAGGGPGVRATGRTAGPGGGARGPVTRGGTSNGATRVTGGGKGPEGGPRAGSGGVRPVVPGPPPRSGTGPSWRDLVPNQQGRGPGPRGPWPGADEQRPVPPPGGTRTGGGEPPGRTSFDRSPPAEPEARGGPAAARGGTTTGHSGLYPPMTGASSAGGADQERRRPDYLIDDTDAFADDRWFTPPVIGADDPLPPR